jgi:hypothetical protein
MKDVGNITRVNPDKRVEALMKFRSRLAENASVCQVTIFIENVHYVTIDFFFKDSTRTGKLGFAIFSQHCQLQSPYHETI